MKKKRVLAKSSASTLPWFIYKPTGYGLWTTNQSQPSSQNSSFGWNSHILANKIAWLQIIGKGNANLSKQSWGGNMSQLKLESIPFLSFSAVQRYFYWSIERKCLNHAHKIFKLCLQSQKMYLLMEWHWRIFVVSCIAINTMNSIPHSHHNLSSSGI